MKRLIGVFDDDSKLLQGIDKILEANIKISDVITPFAVEEVLDKLKIKTNLKTAAFFYALLGGVIGIFLGLYYTFVIDYPINIGGKPNLSLTFVVLIFVGTILVTVLSTVTTFFVIEKKGPGAKPHFEYQGITDDRFLILIEKDTLSEDEIQKVSQLMLDSGAIKIDEK
jgi:hypothetical protein